MDAHRPPRSLLLGLGLIALSGGAGCASFSTHLTPRPTEKGKTEIGINVDVYGTRSTDQKNFIIPVLEFGLRHGLGERADIGGKLSLSKLGGELNSRIALVRSDGFDLSIVPGAGVALGSLTSDEATAFLVSFSLPVLSGIHVNENTQIIFGPKMVAHMSAASSSNSTEEQINGGTSLFPGAVLGVAFKLGEDFMLIPEINVHWPYNLDDSRWAKPVYQGGIGFQFGT